MTVSVGTNCEDVAEESGKTGLVTSAVSTPVGAPRKDLMLRHTVTRRHTLVS